MKELTIEEKAKAYDEAIKRAKELLEVGLKDTRDKRVVLSFFPELAESEDENIRKELILFFKDRKSRLDRMEDILDPSNFPCDDYSLCEKAISWLEKKGEQKSDSIDNKFIRMRETKPNDISDFLDRLTTVEQEFLWEHIAKIRKLDKEEQKSTGKVKPRFKFGNWVVIDSEVLYIKEVTEDGYLTDEGGLIPFRCDKEAHLWTIQDAKDGDVLSYNDGHGNDCIDLIKSITDKKIEFWFCLTNGNRYEVFDGITPYTNLASREDATPATKEQRGLLFQKMHEAGYEWDAEKKELLKIEQKPAWSEDDENRLNHTIQYLEDKDRWKDTERAFPIEEDVRWLKSLRPQSQWRPSEEMLEALYRAIPENTMAISEDEMLLDKLYQGLKYGRVLSNK